jgi:nitric-oxide synthase, brain
VALTEAQSVYNIIVNERGHIYVCGDVTMAENVYQTLRKIIAQRENKPESEVEKFMLRLRVSP